MTFRCYITVTDVGSCKESRLTLIIYIIVFQATQPL